MRRTLTVSSGGSMSLELLPAEPGSVRCFFADGGIADSRAALKVFTCVDAKDMRFIGAHSLGALSLLSVPDLSLMPM